jgi:hypothetical protein
MDILDLTIYPTIYPGVCDEDSKLFFVLRMNQNGCKQIAFGHDLLQYMILGEL